MKRALLVVSCLLLVVSLIGCGQQTPQVKIDTIPTPKGLTIRGIVYGSTVDGNRGLPLSGVSLVLAGGQAQASSVSTTWVTTTDANGEYVFTDLPANNANRGYYITATREGYQRTMTDQLNFGYNCVQPADNSILVRDIDMDGDPVVLSLTPAPGSVIGTTDSIVVQFNEAMSTSTVLPFIIARGTRFFAVGNTQSFTSSWSNGNKTLTIKPLNALSQNMTYSIAVDDENIALDASGYRLETSAPTYSGGLDEDVYNQTSAEYYYRVSSGGIPAAPSGLTIGTDQGPFSSTGVEYGQLFDGTADIDFNWQQSTSGNVTGYRVYISRSAGGPWIFLSGSLENQLTGQDVRTEIASRLFGPSLMVDPVSTRNFPFINERIYARVVAYNGDGESASAEASAIELNPPNIDATVYDTTANLAADQRLVNGYYLPVISDNKVVYIAFDEPVDPSTIVKANFSLDLGANVSAVKLLTTSSSNVGTGNAWPGGGVYSIVQITSDLVVSGKTLTITTGVKDLAGNAPAAAITTLLP